MSIAHPPTVNPKNAQKLNIPYETGLNENVIFLIELSGTNVCHNPTT